MKRLRLAIALVLCSAVALGLLGCEDLGSTTGSSTTTTGLETTTTMEGETSTSVIAALTTTTGAVAKPAASTTTTKASSAIGALPAPTPANKVLKGTYLWEVDNNLDVGGPDADLWYRIVDELVHFLEPVNGAGLARVTGKSFDAITRADLQAMTYKSEPLYTESVDDPDVLMVGSIFALRTNTGQYAKMEVTGFQEGTLGGGIVAQRFNIKLRYVLYPR